MRQSVRNINPTFCAFKVLEFVAVRRAPKYMNNHSKFKIFVGAVRGNLSRAGIDPATMRRTPASHCAKVPHIALGFRVRRWVGSMFTVQTLSTKCYLGSFSYHQFCYYLFLNNGDDINDDDAMT